MRNTIIIAVISLLALGCSKDKFSSTPSLKFESINTKELNKGENMQFKLSFTDLEGDLQDTIYVEKFTINCSASRDTTYYKLPVFPSVKNSEGEIIIWYTYGSGGNYLPIGEPKCGENDTCFYRFAIQDEAKNKSDTVSSDVFVIVK